MKLIPLFYITFFFFSLPIKAQNENDVIESVNTSLVTYAIPISGKDTYFQIRYERLGKKFVIDLYFGGEVISNTTFYRNQIDRIESSISQSGNPVINIFSKDGRMVHYSITENKQTLMEQLNIPLKASEEEALKIKNSFENLFQLK